MNIHICKPLDTTRTLCGQAAGLVAAVNWASFPIAHGPFCPECFGEAQEEQVRERERWEDEEHSTIDS